MQDIKRQSSRRIHNDNDTEDKESSTYKKQSSINKENDKEIEVLIEGEKPQKNLGDNLKTDMSDDDRKQRQL